MNIRQLQLREMAELIRSKIRGGQLMGEPVNLTDMDELVVAAYLCGEAKGKEEVRRNYIHPLGTVREDNHADLELHHDH